MHAFTTITTITTNAPTIICICGKRRSGKDVAAHYIEQQYNFKHVKLASPLKTVISILFGFSDEQMETDLKEEEDRFWKISPRQAMQFLGTEIMQHEIQKMLPWIGKTFFVRRLLQDNNPKEKPIVISDMRFLHEYEYLKEFNPLVIRIVRDQSFYNAACDTHISEVECDKIPAIDIVNDGTIQDLRDKLDSLLSQFDS